MKEPLYDGCSGYMSLAWRKFLKRPPPWEHCCDLHDVYYAKGGSKLLRLVADESLRCCIRRNGWPIMAEIMYRAVRIGGVPWLPTPYRWGFETKNYRYINNN